MFFSYAHICAEINLSKGLPNKKLLKYRNYKFIQNLDYENKTFRCQHCNQTGHLQENYPQLTSQPKKKKGCFSKSKSKQTYGPPPNDKEEES